MFPRAHFRRVSAGLRCTGCGSFLCLLGLLLQAFLYCSCQCFGIAIVRPLWGLPILLDAPQYRFSSPVTMLFLFHRPFPSRFYGTPKFIMSLLHSPIESPYPYRRPSRARFIEGVKCEPGFMPSSLARARYGPSKLNHEFPQSQALKAFHHDGGLFIACKTPGQKINPLFPGHIVHLPALFSPQARSARSLTGSFLFFVSRSPTVGVRSTR